MSTKSPIALAVLMSCAPAAAFAQGPSSSFDRGASQQTWQNPGHAALVANCATPPQPFSIGGGQSADAANAAPPPEPPAPPASTEIPGVIAAGQNWKVVWQWEGNNADGIMAGDGGTMLFATTPRPFRSAITSSLLTA